MEHLLSQMDELEKHSSEHVVMLDTALDKFDKSSAEMKDILDDMKAKIRKSMEEYERDWKDYCVKYEQASRAVRDKIGELMADINRMQSRIDEALGKTEDAKQN